MVRLIHVIHWIVLLFVLTGWAWPWIAAQWVHLAFIPIMLLHWKTNQNRCILTQLEERYKAPSAETIVVEENQFIKLVWKFAFGRVPSPATLDRLVHAIVIGSWCLSAIRVTVALRHV